MIHPTPPKADHLWRKPRPVDCRAEHGMEKPKSGSHHARVLRRPTMRERPASTPTLRRTAKRRHPRTTQTLRQTGARVRRQTIRTLRPKDSPDPQIRRHHTFRNARQATRLAGSDSLRSRGSPTTRTGRTPSRLAPHLQLFGLGRTCWGRVTDLTLACGPRYRHPRASAKGSWQMVARSHLGSC